MEAGVNGGDNEKWYYSPLSCFRAACQGLPLYQRDGYMCAEVVNPDRPKRADVGHGTPEEKVAAADGTFAYCGRYEIDLKQQRIVHLPEVATDPGYMGARQIRPYRFEGGLLVFSEVEKNDPSVASWKLVWEKVQQRPAATTSPSGAFGELRATARRNCRKVRLTEADRN